MLEGGNARLPGKSERETEAELKKQVARLERSLDKKIYELELAGNFLREWE